MVHALFEGLSSKDRKGTGRIHLQSRALKNFATETLHRQCRNGEVV